MGDRHTKAQLREHIERLEAALRSLVTSHKDYTEAHRRGHGWPDLRWATHIERRAEDSLHFSSAPRSMPVSGTIGGQRMMEKLLEIAEAFAAAADRIDLYDGEHFQAPLYAMQRGSDCLRELLIGRDGEPLTVAHLRALRDVLRHVPGPGTTEES